MRTGLAIIAIAVVVIAAAVAWIGWGPGSEHHNVGLVKAWIANNNDEWQKFVAEHPSLRGAQLYAYASGNGTLVIGIPKGATDGDELALYRFIHKRFPPRPVVPARSP